MGVLLFHRCQGLGRRLVDSARDKSFRCATVLSLVDETPGASPVDFVLGRMRGVTAAWHGVGREGCTCILPELHMIARSPTPYSFLDFGSNVPLMAFPSSFGSREDCLW